MVATYVSVRINGFRIALPLPNHKGNFNRKTLLYVGRKPTSFTTQPVCELAHLNSSASKMLQGILCLWWSDAMLYK